MQSESNRRFNENNSAVTYIDKFIRKLPKSFLPGKDSFFSINKHQSTIIFIVAMQQWKKQYSDVKHSPAKE